ncbi:arginine repressor, partial [Avibacterium avium]
AELSVPTSSSPLKNLVLDIDHNDFLIVVKTSPGAAQLIARLLDSVGKADGILGTIAGDDTIFITPTSDTAILDLMQRVQELFETSL